MTDSTALGFPPIDPRRLDANWRAVTAELDAPRAGRLERMLRAVGLPARVTRLMVATPALRRSWYLALGIALVVGLGSADQAQGRDSAFTMLVLAPLLPVLGVTLAYGPQADPAYEVQLAMPLSGLRLVATRVITVLVTAMVIIGSLSLLNPVLRPVAAAWLAPALALATASLALMTWLAPRRAGAVAAVAWISIVLVARGLTGDQLAVFGAVGQVAAIAATVGFLTVATLRRASFDRLVYAS